MQGLSPDGSRFLNRLRQDTAGNVFAIAAAGLLPLAAMIGGGVDISRAYMAKTELQAACDAAVLAGRRAMSRTGEYEETEKAKADRMFEFNFDGASVQARNIQFDSSDNEDGQVFGTASAQVPTAVMKIFGKTEIDLTVDCMAELQIGNADIMFVLDTTGSMGDPIGDDDDEPDKIDGLRDAVRDFHRTINQAVNDNRTRIRYGFVPYSSTVNAGELFADPDTPMPRDYFTDSTWYRTRVANFSTKAYIADTPEELDSGIETYSTKITEADCDKYGENKYPSSNGKNPVTSGTAPNPVTATEYNYEDWTGPFETTGTGKNKKTIGTCKRRFVKTRTTYETWWKFTNWVYQRLALDTSAFKNGDTVNIATDVSTALVDTKGDYNLIDLAQIQAGTSTKKVEAMNVVTTGYTWNGCLEERATVNTDNFDPLPADAFNLKIDLEPDANNSDTLWKPMWREVEYVSSKNPSAACPSPMSLFRTVELSDDPDDIPDWLNTTVNNLNPTGNTYHDIGMIWGGRLTSPTGIFAENVNLDADKISVSKHIIFMTDGIMQPSSSVYSAYGVESADHRIAPSNKMDKLTDYHNARFSAMCEEIKSKGVTIWVVAFGTTMTNRLRNCATGGRAYYSSNTEALRSTFRFIAAQVADLRLGA